MRYRIAADSSANLLGERGGSLVSVPLKIVTGEREYVDNAALDVDAMVADLAAYKGRSGSSCPNVQDWLDAFAGAEGIFAVTITSSLSGSYTSASLAKREYEKDHPGARVHVIDTLSAGPEIQLIVEKLRALIDRGLEFDGIVEGIGDYCAHTHLLFSLESMKNLARNGRTSHAAATIAGVLGIRIVGKASQEGTLDLLYKCRGAKHTIQTTYESMVAEGYAGGRVCIAQCQNAEGAGKLRQLIHRNWPSADVHIVPCRGLCAFYAESGGLMIGYEDAGA